MNIVGVNMNIHSEQIDLITAALSKAQAEIENPSKDNLNPHFKSRYADLATVLEVCRGPLSKHGLSITQPLFMEGEKLVLATILSHTSGQWIKSFIPLPVQKPGSQEIGSCITYMRRYSLASLVGIFQEDDDGEASEVVNRESDEDRSKLSMKQKNLLSDLINQLREPAHIEVICKKHKLESIYDINRDKFNDLLEFLKTKIQEKRNAAA